MPPPSHHKEECTIFLIPVSKRIKWEWHETCNNNANFVRWGNTFKRRRQNGFKWGRH